MKKHLFVMFCCLAGLFSGCVQYDYVGQKFPPTESGAVSFYEKESDVPREKLFLIGRMTMLFDQPPGKYDVQDRLMKKAREYGADAVSFVSQTKVQEGIIEEPVLAAQFPNSNDPAGMDMYGESYTVNSFGQQVSVAESADYDWVVKALFWKDRKTAEEALAKRKDLLKDPEDKNVKKMAPVIRVPAAKKPEPPQK